LSVEERIPYIAVNHFAHFKKNVKTTDTTLLCVKILISKYKNNIGNMYFKEFKKRQKDHCSPAGRCPKLVDLKEFSLLPE